MYFAQLLSVDNLWSGAAGSLEGYHQRGPTHPNEDTDRSYPEGFHQREPTHPTEKDADRPYPEGFHQKGPKIDG
jgi:hypothetical protein